MRENISEAIAMRGWVTKNDITIPVQSLPSLFDQIDLSGLTRSETVDLLLFGHVGDGNIHVNYSAPKDRVTEDQFRREVSTMEQTVFALVQRYKGSISSEHGIGNLKVEQLKNHRDPEQLALMKQIKTLLDPKGLLNPGKILA